MVQNKMHTYYALTVFWTSVIDLRTACPRALYIIINNFLKYLQTWVFATSFEPWFWQSSKYFWRSLIYCKLLQFATFGNDCLKSFECFKFHWRLEKGHIGSLRTSSRNQLLISKRLQYNSFILKKIKVKVKHLGFSNIYWSLSYHSSQKNQLG